jgi:uncharacterized OB-fold protein
MHKKSAPFSWRSSKEQYRLARDMEIKGVIESFTIVHSPPQEFEGQSPYIIALLALDNGRKVVSQIVECRNVDIGMKVEPCLRKIYEDGEDGLISYGAKFRIAK